MRSRPDGSGSTTSPWSQTTPPLGNVRAFDLEPGAATRFGYQRHAAGAKAVRRKLVAVRRDAKPDLLVHQSGLIKRNQAVGIGVMTDAAGRLQLDHGHAAAGLLIDDVDGKVATGLRLRSCRAAGGQRQKQSERKAHAHDAHVAHDSPRFGALPGSRSPHQSFRSPCRLRRWMVLCPRSWIAWMYRIVRLWARMRME